MALVDLEPDTWQADYTAAERLHRCALECTSCFNTIC